MIAFTTDDLATIFRQEVDDVLSAAPPSPVDADRLWKNAEVFSYMTEAADAVATDVEGIYKVLQFPITPAAIVAPPVPIQITLPRNVLHIREAKLLSLGTYVAMTRANDHVIAAYDTYGPPVRNSALLTYGVPTELVRDYYNRAFYLLPIPNITDTLELQCTVTIGVPLAAGMPLPFLSIPDQRLMLLYMKKLAYAKHDADTLDLERSTGFDRAYRAAAIERASRLNSYRRPPGTVRMEW